MKKGIISMLCIALAVGTLTGCGSKKEDNRLVIWTNMNVEVDTLQKYAIPGENRMDMRWR